MIYVPGLLLNYREMRKYDSPTARSLRLFVPLETLQGAADHRGACLELHYIHPHTLVVYSWPWSVPSSSCPESSPAEREREKAKLCVNQTIASNPTMQQ